jgi:CRP-like cAMP-binding protein
VGTRFYIILSGSCGVYKTYAKQTQEKTENSEEPINKTEKDKVTPNVENGQDSESKRDYSLFKSKQSRLSILTKGPNAISAIKDLTRESKPRQSITLQIASRMENKHFLELKRSGLIANSEKIDDKTEHLRLYQVGNRILNEEKILYAGVAFGEIALMDNVRRKATIIAKQDTHLAYLDKEFFDKILSKKIVSFINLIEEKEEKKHAENLDFLCNLKFFFSFSRGLIQQIYYLSIRKHVIKNQVIYSEGQDSTEIYIIKSGQFLVNIRTFFLD